MNQGAKTIIYPVSDITKAKAMFTALLGVEPYVDQAYYVGYMVEGQNIGLDPNGHRDGVTAYYDVADIQKTLQALLDNGATTVQEVREVGGGKQTAIVKDAEGNIIGIAQNA